jgi:hypothetical protein
MTDDRKIDPEAVDAVEMAWFAWNRFENATNPVIQADALLHLASAMSDVATWLPGYDPNTGEVASDD